MRAQPKLRPAFTLVELLVAAGIIAMLLALVAISYPSINEREQLTRAVDKLRTGFLTARLWARRDNVVTGLRFNSSGTFFNYVQTPMEHIHGEVTGLPSSSTVEVNLLSGLVGKIKPNKTNPEQTDYFLLEGDLPHSIAPPLTSEKFYEGTATIGTIYLNSSLSISVLNKHPFRIIRGVQLIPLQEDSVFGERISVSPSTSLVLNEILFLPSGQVFNSPTSRIKFTLTQQALNPNDGDEAAEVILDCLSGTTQYTNP